jgi:hypothetical protein
LGGALKGPGPNKNVLTSAIHTEGMVQAAAEDGSAAPAPEVPIAEGGEAVPAPAGPVAEDGATVSVVPVVRQKWKRQFSGTWSHTDDANKKAPESMSKAAFGKLLLDLLDKIINAATKERS